MTMINGRTPEEIKLGLECCVVEYKICDECPFADVYLCEEKLRDCAIILIKQLQENNKQLERKYYAAVDEVNRLCRAVKKATDDYHAMKRERDAAVEAAQPKWISVEEPPKHTCDYLVYVWVAYPDGFANMQMRTGTYNVARKEWTIPHGRFEVVGEPECWMPLPEPPKEN